VTLQAILDSGALESHPPHGELHVSFDALLSGSSVEQEVSHAVENSGRLVIAGVSGSGKTSVMLNAVSRASSGVLPIRLQVATERREVAMDPRTCLQHLHDTMVRMLKDRKKTGRRKMERLRQRATTTTTPTPRRWTVTAAVSMASLSPISVQASPILANVTRERSTIEIAEALGDVFDISRRHDLAPVVLVDDTDTWTQAISPAERDDRVEGFFTKVLRTLSELPCGLVVAAHNEYLAMPAFQAAQGILKTGIAHVPTLGDGATVRRLLHERVCLADESNRNDQWLTSGIDPSLFNYYERVGRNLRRVIVAVAAAAEHAVEGGFDVVRDADLQFGISQWEQPGT
jgi:hypothetical protein